MPRNPNLAALKESGFIGNHVQSPNKQFLIAWIDGDLDQGVIGARKEGNGKFLIIENGKIILRGEVERPNDCKIANNGSFIINDWLFSNRLNGIFYAYEKTGEELISHRFSANLRDNCISSDGKFAACTLGNSNSKDGGLLAVFDLEKGALLNRIYPEDDAGILFEISPEEKTITFDYTKFGQFKYSFDGMFLDKERWYQAHLEQGSAFDLLYIAEEKLREKNTLDTETTQGIITILNKALGKGLGQYKKEEAKAYRFIGEAYELMSLFEKAIENYERALSIDPKVGIRRYVDSLKKKI
jgi:tetratricopeptide (TPR) repeat protein